MTKLTQQTLSSNIDNEDLMFQVIDTTTIPKDRKLKYETLKNFVLDIVPLADTSVMNEDTDIMYLLQDPSGSPSQRKVFLNKIKARESVFVNSINDFPAPSGGVITFIESKEYIINANITTSLRFECNVTGVNIKFTSHHNLNYTLEYTGTGTFITLTNCDNFICDGAFWIKGNVSATLFGVSGAGRIHLLNMPLLGWGDLGTVAGVTYNHVFGATIDCGQGMVFDGCDEVIINKVEQVVWKNQVSVMYTFKNAINYIQISLGAFSMNANETAFDFEQSLQAPLGVLINDNVFSETGTTFTPTSKIQEDVEFNVSGNSRIPDSTVKGNMFFAGNSTTTTINTVDVPEQIEGAIWGVGNIIIPERMACQDFCTFDNATDTIITTFNHALSNEDIVTFVADGGLPTQILEDTLYFVANVTATTFQIELSIGGGIIDFTNNGTPPNYYRHRTGTSEGWIVYTGVPDVTVSVNGWIGIRNAGGGDKDAGAHLIFTDTSFVETLKAQGSLVTTNSTKPQSSQLADLVILSTGEGLKFFIENRTDTINLIGTDGHIIITKI